MKCPQCAEEINDEAVLCKHCGSRLTLCPVCGKRALGRGETYCSTECRVKDKRPLRKRSLFIALLAIAAIIKTITMIEVAVTTGQAVVLIIFLGGVAVWALFRK